MADRRELTHSDYTLAWICALPIELAAAAAMLDEIHPKLPSASTAYNTYILGRIEGHNVVLACLPSGLYGMTSATAVASCLQSDFPNIRYGVMVGIGGGVPNTTTDIRLGDVVVSKPTGTSGGVIQYDLGKAVTRGQFEVTGMLNRPPTILLTAVSQLEASRMRKEANHILKIASIVLERNPDMKATFSRPREDSLFPATYNHLLPGRSCASCDVNQQINRARRVSDEPQVHYGIIASGNQVIKDAYTRDQIAQKLNALCFEMEAAGIMNHLPCLVIRGISDYCDSHKNKEWQGYAALTAAAFTKELLSTVPLPATAEVNIINSHAPRNLTVLPAIESVAGRQYNLDYQWDYLQLARSISRTVSIIHGLGGLREISLAIRFAREHKNHLASIIWQSDKDQASLVQSLSSCPPPMSGQFVDIDVITKEAEQRDSQMLQRLVIRNNSGWLIIFDNIDQDSALHHHTYICCSCNNGPIVYTRRRCVICDHVACINCWTFKS